MKLEDAGTTRLAGQTVHHYRGVKRLSVTVPSTTAPKITVSIAFDIYVDGHNRLVRLHAVNTQPHVGPSTDQVDYSDYGVVVDVKAPPADQVVRESDLPAHK